MKLNTKSSMAFIAIVLFATLGTIAWAINWYKANPINGGSFTPGDLGDAFNIPLLVATLVAVVYSVSAYHNSTVQLEEARIDQKNRHLDQLLSAALLDYHRRSESPKNEQYFRLALNHLVEYDKPGSTHDSGERWTHFRAANYMLKPIAYWCSWLSEDTNYGTTEYNLVMKSSAYRIMAAMSSDAQVYLLLAHDIQLEKVQGRKDEYSRIVQDHVEIYEFLEKYASKALDGCREGNQGQMKIIRDFLHRTDWYESESARELFF
jgi:hypothetical protein